MNPKPPRYGQPAPLAATLLGVPTGGSRTRKWPRLSPSEIRFHELSEPPAEGRYVWDEAGAIVVWFPANASPEAVRQARARLDCRVVVGDEG